MSTLAPPAPPAERTSAPNRFRGSWRTSLRIARREMRRAKGRHALIAAMIGVPIMLIAGLAVFARTTEVGPAEAALRDLGAADALVSPEARGPIVQDPYAVTTAPSADANDSGTAPRPWTTADVAAATSAEAHPLHTGSTLVHVDEGALAATVRELDVRDPISTGLARITAGRAPSSDAEVAVSEAVLDRGYAVGDPIEVGRAEPVTMRISGVVRNPADLDSAQLLALPGAVLPTGDAGISYLVDAGGDIGWERVRELNELGLAVISRAVVTDPPPPAAIPEQVRMMQSGDGGLLGFYVLVVAIIVLEVILLAGPAFAVGARRQSRQLALLVTTGATPRDVRRIVLAQALLLGLGTAAFGALLGLAGVVLGRPVLEQLVGAEVGPVRVPALELLALIAVGTFAAVAAAFVPARQAARQDPVATLAGRRGEARPRRGWPIVGLVLVGIGLALIFVVDFGTAELPVVFGTIALVLGAILLTPALLGLIGRLGSRLPLAGRLATRDAARQRSRTTPAVAAIMGAVTGVTALAIGSASDFAEERRDYAPQLPMGTLAVTLSGESGFGDVADDVVRRVEADPGGHTPYVLRSSPSVWEAGSVRTATVLRPGCGTDPEECAVAFAVKASAGATVSYGSAYSGALVAEPDGIAARLGRVLSPEQERVLDAGGVLVPHGSAIDSGRAMVATHTEDRDGIAADTVRTTDLPAAVLSKGHAGTAYDYLADLVLTPETAQHLGLDIAASQVIVPPGDHAFTTEQQAELNEFVRSLLPDRGEPVYVERGFSRSYAPVFAALVAVGGLIVLVGTATATALALTDARPDFATLGAVGASTGLRRRVAMAQAGVIGGLGALFGIAVGLGPGIAITYPLTGQSANGHILDIPWSVLGIVVVAVPALAVLGAGVFTRSRLPLDRRVE